MSHSNRTINYRVAFSMAIIWLVAMILLTVMLVLTLLPQVRLMEQKQMSEHLVRAASLVKADIKRIDAFARDWAEWDDAYYFMAGKGVRRFITTNLINSDPLDDFDIHVMTFMRLDGEEVWSRARIPAIDPEHMLDAPLFLDQFKKRLLKRANGKGVAGIEYSTWGPLFFSLHAITDTGSTKKTNGYLLAVRWMDQEYLAELSGRMAFPLKVQNISHYPNLKSFISLQKDTLYRLGYRGLGIQWGELVLLDSTGHPGLMLHFEMRRELMLEGGRVLLFTLLGTLLICLACGLFAFYRLQKLVLQPLERLLQGVLSYERHSDVTALPVIESSREMKILTHRFREMAARLSYEHKAVQAHSQRMEEAANRDSLTGCFNRRYLDGWLQVHRAKPCLLLLLDLDHFKRINDSLGHDIGDLVLKQLAELLHKAVTGQSEPVIRLGGEEFLLLLQVDDDQELALRVEYLRQRIAQHRFGTEDAPFWVTVSLGFCRYPLHPACPDSFWSHSFKLADMALYQAKIGGRNRWCGYAGTLASREEMGQSPEQLAEREDFLLLHSVNQA